MEITLPRTLNDKQRTYVIWEAVGSHWSRVIRSDPGVGKTKAAAEDTGTGKN